MWPQKTKAVCGGGSSNKLLLEKQIDTKVFYIIDDKEIFEAV